MLSAVSLRRRPEDRMWFLDGLHTVHLREAPADDDRLARVVADGASALRARGLSAAAPEVPGWRR